MRRTVILALAVALTVAACSQSVASWPATTATAAAATTTATEEPTEAAKSVVCEFYPGIEHEIAVASVQSVSGNPAAATRQAINDIQALAAKAADPTEKKDLSNLADTMDSAVMAGGSFSDWDPAFEAFHAKYGPRCGQVVLTPPPA